MDMVQVGILTKHGTRRNPIFNEKSWRNNFGITQLNSPESVISQGFLN